MSKSALVERSGLTSQQMDVVRESLSYGQRRTPSEIEVHTGIARAALIKALRVLVRYGSVESSHTKTVKNIEGRSVTERTYFMTRRGF